MEGNSLHLKNFIYIKENGTTIFFMVVVRFLSALTTTTYIESKSLELIGPSVSQVSKYKCVIVIV